LEWIAGGAFLPIFPVYMKDQGASPALVGAIVAAYFIAGLFCQIPAGRAVDHFGPRRILLIGQGLYAASTLAFVATSTPTSALAFRFTQGLGAGMAEVAALSIVGVAAGTFTTPIPAPLLIIHGGNDEQIPVVSSAALFDQMCKIGQVEQRWVFPGQSHAGVIAPSFNSMLAWMNDRFQGNAMPDPLQPPNATVQSCGKS
jgi:hypothetical protein